MLPVAVRSSPSAPLLPKNFSLSFLRTSHSRVRLLKGFPRERSFRGKKCRAEFSADGPVAVAIGACILNSLIFPDLPLTEDTEEETLIDSSGARFAVMGIISFIPYFNWMSWVFAWFDTMKPRYAVYALVYLAPYLRSNLSISPEESWLPIASILLCIIHIQIEASIANGDIHGFQLLNEVVKLLSSTKRESRISRKRGERNDFHDLPSPEEHYRKEIRDWAAPRTQPEDHDRVDGEENDTTDSDQ